jgi:hypothetical protein
MQFSRQTPALFDLVSCYETRDLREGIGRMGTKLRRRMELTESAIIFYNFHDEKISVTAWRYCLLFSRNNQPTRLDDCKAGVLNSSAEEYAVAHWRSAARMQKGYS